MRPFIHSSTLSSERPIEEAAAEEIKDEPVFLQFLRLRSLSPLVYYTVLFLLLGHLAVTAVLPLFISDETYLYFYLGKDARESTKIFLNGKHPFLVYDDILGWRNRSNVKHDKWNTDERGARTTPGMGASSSGKRVVMFLGNSLINGGTDVSDQETISAYIEDESTESLNFATMLYALDQVYLSYKERLSRYKADVVVVGLPGESTAALLNQYIPFRVKFENKMPFFKPRFEMHPESAELSIISVPPLKGYEHLFDDPHLLRTLAERDVYYREFNRYKWFGLMPGTESIYSIYERIRHYLLLIRGNDEGMQLRDALIDKMVVEAGRRDASMIFLVLPDLKTVSPRLWQRYLPDRYGEMVKDLKEKGYNILDARPPLRQCGIPPGKLFHPDGVHFSAAGNRVIAAALKDAIAQLK